MPADRELAPEGEETSRAEPLDTERRPREDVIAEWRAGGYDTRMEIVEAGRIRCDACGVASEPEDCDVDDTFRYEGMSDPEDLELLLAVTCGSCAAKGTLTLGYGPYAGPDEAEAARRLPDRRRQ